MASSFFSQVDNENKLLNFLENSTMLDPESRKITGVKPDIVGEYYCLNILMDDTIINDEEFNTVMRFILCHDIIKPINYIGSIIDSFWLEKTESPFYEKSDAFSNEIIMKYYRFHALYILQSVLLTNYLKAANEHNKAFLDNLQDLKIETVLQDGTQGLVSLFEIEQDNIKIWAEYFINNTEAICRNNKIKFYRLSSFPNEEEEVYYKGLTLWGFPCGYGTFILNDGTTYIGQIYNRDFFRF